MTSAASHFPQSSSFPAGQIETCVREALGEKAETQAILQGHAPSSPTAGGWEPAIDSLTVVLVICEIEELMGVSLPRSFIPRGGYSTKNECVNDLVAQAKSVWMANAKAEVVHA